MKLSRESQALAEAFFRVHTGDPELRLPPISIHGGAAARLLMWMIGMSAITFGRRVFVRPSHLARDSEGRAVMPGWLLIHEAAHVLQYEERGYLRFFRDYLRNYWRGLRGAGGWGAACRMAAYMAIAEECEAREAEHAYRTKAAR